MIPISNNSEPTKLDEKLECGLYPFLTTPNGTKKISRIRANSQKNKMPARQACKHAINQHCINSINP
jgi:hypothetical protein